MLFLSQLLLDHLSQSSLYHSFVDLHYMIYQRYSSIVLADTRVSLSFVYRHNYCSSPLLQHLFNTFSIYFFTCVPASLTNSIPTPSSHGALPFFILARASSNSCSVNSFSFSP